MKIKNYCENCPIKDTTFFAKLKESQVNQIACIMQLKRYRKGDVLFLDGDSCNHVFAIRSGMIKTYKSTKDGKDQILNIAIPGYFLGLEAIYNDFYRFSAEVVVDSEVCFLKKNELLKLLKNNYDIAIEILKILTDELEQARNQVRDLGVKNARQRVASFLLLPLFFMTIEDQNRKTLHTPLTRQEISELLGLTMETVSRVLSQFHNEKIIRANRSKIELLDIQQLLFLSE